MTLYLTLNTKSTPDRLKVKGKNKTGRGIIYTQSKRVLTIRSKTLTIKEKSNILYEK